MPDPALSFALQVPDPSWETILPEPEAFCLRAVDSIMASIESGTAETLQTGEVCVVLSNDAAVQDLNRDWRGKDAPTNVLSFPADDDLDDEDPVLGDVILALETVSREASEQGKNITDHVAHLLVHGILHLLGYDHQNDRDAGQMEDLERKILGQMGIDDPYGAETGP